MIHSQSTRVLTRRKTRTAEKAAPLKLFALLSGQRPVSGPRMYAHTQAALIVLGISRTKSVPQASVVHLLGQRAFDYHVIRLQNMIVKGDKVALTKAGHEFFEARIAEGRVPVTLVEGFVSVFLTGKPDADVRVAAHQINTTPR